MHLAEPYVGITNDGSVRAGLVDYAAGGAGTARVTESARAFLAALSPEQRAKATFPLDAEERRTWLNIHPYVFRHGVMLEELSPATARCWRST